VRHPAPLRLRRVLARLLLVPLGIAAGCMTGGPHASERPFVITNASQLRDLYWRGELTDSKGNRWRIWIVPGITPPLEGGAEAFSDAWDYSTELFEGPFWKRRGKEARDGLEFAIDDVARDFLVDGIADDYRNASQRISKNIADAPFAWIPRIVANALVGYVAKPAARTALAPVGIAGGLAYSALVPPANVVARPVGSVAWAGFAGIAWPAFKLTWHQPAYLLSMPNREPDVSHHGDFGMYVIEWAEGSRPGGEPHLPEAPVLEEETVLEPPEVEPAWTREDHRKAYDDDPSYRRGYDYGFERGRKAGREKRKPD
jgi:hypothetical protein